MDPVIVEAVTAAIGIEDILRGTPTFGLGKQGRALAIPRDIQRLTAQYVRQTEPTELTDMPPFDVDEVVKLLSEAGSADQIQALHLTIGDEGLASEVEAHATHVIEMLQAAMPTREIETLTSTITVPPSAQELARFRRMWQIANDPTAVLRDLLDGSMSLDQAQAMESMWPALHGVVQPAVVDTVADKKAKQPSWDLGYSKETRLRVLLLLPRTESIAKDVQGVYASSKAEGGKPKPTSLGQKSFPADKALTPAQRNELPPGAQRP